MCLMNVFDECVWCLMFDVWGLMFDGRYFNSNSNNHMNFTVKWMCLMADK